MRAHCDGEAPGTRDVVERFQRVGDQIPDADDLNVKIGGARALVAGGDQEVFDELLQAVGVA